MKASRLAPDSPCVGVCRMDPRSGLCVGCLRTLEEIGDWPASSTADKVRVLARIAERRCATRRDTG